MALRYLVPALAVAGRAAAAACSGTTTISNSADATGLATCAQYTGDIWIAPSTSGDIALDGIQRIHGSLYAKNVPHMTSLSASTLGVIDDTFGLNNIQTLTSLNFPSLIEVNTILWTALPSLQGLSFTQSIQKASQLNIQNTELSSLEGINLQMVDELVLANNPFLDDVTMQLGNVSTALAFAANGRNLKVDFPNMIWAKNMTFRNVSSLTLDSLAYVNGSFGCYSNFFQSLSAPNLTVIGGTLSFVSNGALNNVSFPSLKGIAGALQLANNTQLKKVDGFPRLTDVYGAVEMYGAFSSVSLPSLHLVKGAFNLFSTANLGSTCSHFRSIAGPNSDIRGKFSCAGQQQSPSSSNSGSSVGSSSGSSGSSGAGSLIIPYATGIIGIVAAVFGLL